MDLIEHRHAFSELADSDCAHFPDLIRLNYFHGQHLGERDLRDEQRYFRERLKLINRCLHGYGVVCGLEVCPGPAKEECPPKHQEKRDELLARRRALETEIARLKKASEAGEDVASEIADRSAEREEVERELERLKHGGGGHAGRPLTIVVKCGLALDCEGNELVVRRPRTVDLRGALAPSDWEKISSSACSRVYVSLCHVECGIEPTRPVVLDECGMTPACQYGRVREDVRVKVSLEPPEEDRRCELCCEPCAEPCVLLAAIEIDLDQPLTEGRIDNGVRRGFGLYESTVITGISWQHGTTYTSQRAAQILGTDQPNGGIVVRFSRRVRIETIRPGVFDLWRVQGGRGLSALITHISGEYVDLPASGYVSEVKYRDTTGETLQHGDRVLVIVRAGFILDRCCRPVDGEHVGGKVPPIAPTDANQAYRQPEMDECRSPPGRFGPWTSGNGVPGGSFESWFFVD